MPVCQAKKDAGQESLEVIDNNTYILDAKDLDNDILRVIAFSYISTVFSYIGSWRLRKLLIMK